jgi:hypothetical protein
MGRGKISPIKTQAPGPQVDAKKKMYIQVKTIKHKPAALLPSSTVPTDEHANSAVNQKCATAKLLDSPKGDGRGTNIDGGRDHGDQEGILNADRLEERGAVVEDCHHMLVVFL